MRLQSIKSFIESLTPRQIFGCLLFLGFLAYANAIFHPFVHDDIVFIPKNPYIHSLDLKQIFYQTAMPGADHPLVNKYYRPLLEFINRLLYRVFADSPYGYHAFNIVLHVLNSFMVFLIVKKLWKERMGAALCLAILFLLHPIQSEAVACISGISNLVFTLLCLLTIWLFMLSSHHPNRRGMGFYVLSLFSFFAALLAKEQAIVLPVVIIGLSLCTQPFSIKNLSKMILPWLGHVVVLIGFLMMKVAILGAVMLKIIDTQGEFWLRIFSIPRQILTHLTLIFFPHDLHYYRCLDILAPVGLPIVLMAIVLSLIISLLISIKRPLRPLAIFGLGFFLVTLSPTLNIVPLVNEYSFLLLAEHFVYFPIIGILIFVGCLWETWTDKFSSVKRFSIALGIVCFFALIYLTMTIKQNTYWQSEIILFNRTLKFEPNFGRVRILLAKAYYREGRYDEAIAEFEKARLIIQGYIDKVVHPQIRPFYLSYMEEIYMGLGTAYYAKSDNGQAIAQYSKALAFGSKNGILHSSLGMSYLRMGDISKAIEYFEQAVLFNDSDLMAKNSLALCYKEVGRFQEAKELFRQIVEKDPDSKSARENLDSIKLQESH